MTNNDADDLTERCEACGKRYAWDEMCGMYSPDCECTQCTVCRVWFKADDNDGPCVAPTDEAAAVYSDDPRCSKCWAKVKAKRPELFE